MLYAICMLSYYASMHTNNTKYAYYALRVIVLLGYELVLTLEYA